MACGGLKGRQKRRRRRRRGTRVSPVQGAILERLTAELDRACRAVPEPIVATPALSGDKTTADFLYESACHKKEPPVKLTRSNMSIPKTGGDENRVHLLDVVPPALADRLRRHGLRRIGPSLEPPRPAHLVEDDEYYHVAIALEKAGLLARLKVPALVINGIFGVGKAGTDLLRVILDARIANLLSCDPDNPCLPSIRSLVLLGVRAGEQVRAAVSDLANFYHLILIPVLWQQMFGIPSVTDPVTGEVIHLAWRTLPMGAALAVFLAETVYQYTLSRRCLEYEMAGRLPSHATPTLLNAKLGVADIYIDDLISLNVCIRAANALLAAARLHAPVPVSDKKYKEAVDGTAALFWGVELSADGCFRPQREKLAALIALTREYLAQPFISVKDLQALTGKWLWNALLCRLLLSCFDPLFRQCRARGRAVRWWPSTRATLHRLIVLSPLLVADPARLPGRAGASDSSDYGGAVCLAEQSGHDVYWACADLCYFKGRADMQSEEYYKAVATAVEAHRFRPAYRWEWKDPGEFIGVKEARAAVSSIERLVLRSGVAALGRRHWLFVDNQSFVGAMTKGRSRNASINSLLQRTAAWFLATGSTADLIWTPSALEPADYGSRHA
jgi:hypothetical protein